MRYSHTKKLNLSCSGISERPRQIKRSMVLKCNKKSDEKTMILIQQRKGIFSLTWGLEDLTLAAVQTYPLDLHRVNSSVGGVLTCTGGTAAELFAGGYLRMWETARWFYSHYQISSNDAQKHHTGLAWNREAYEQETHSLSEFQYFSNDRALS